MFSILTGRRVSILKPEIALLYLSLSLSTMSSDKRPRAEHSDEALIALDAELFRSRLVYQLCEKLHKKVEEEFHIDDMSLFVGFVFETVAAASVFLRKVPRENPRSWVHAQLDLGKTLIRRRGAGERSSSSAATRSESEEVLGTFKRVEFRAEGVFAVIEPLTASTTGDAAAASSDTLLSVPLSECLLQTPQDLFLDPMIPCGEIVEPHHSPLSVYALSLSKLCEADKKKEKTFKSKKRAAWVIADYATRLAQEARQAMHSYEPKPFEGAVVVTEELVEDDKGHKEPTTFVKLDKSNLSDTSFPFETDHTLASWQYQKLKRFYEQTNADAPESFHARLYTMLQRYTGVTGLFSRIEAGWHAAVPPQPFDHLRYQMDAQAECFASPLNARLPKFCSAFRDTDRFFGSLGSFIDYFPEEGSFEVGPPYDHEVMRIAFDHALECLASPRVSGPLCFTFIIPESSRDHGKLVRAAVDASPFNRVSEVLPKDKAKYIDGFQHRPGENRLICISCDTRIIILQNDAAMEKWPPVEHFAVLKEKWLTCDEVIETSGESKE